MAAGVYSQSFEYMLLSTAMLPQVRTQDTITKSIYVHDSPYEDKWVEHVHIGLKSGYKP